MESDIEIPELLSIDKNEQKVDIKIKKDIIPKDVIEKTPLVILGLNMMLIVWCLL